MPHTMPDRSLATPRDTLAAGSGPQAKADLHPQRPATRLRDVAAEALRRTTSQKAAASDMTLSAGRLSHKIQDGTLTLAQLEALGPTYGMRLGEVCREHYGTEDPQARIRRAIREARQKFDELAEAL